GRLLLLEVIPIAPTHHGLGVFADREPALGALSRVDADRGAGPAHPGARPAGIDGVAQNLRPQPSQREGQSCDVELAFSVGPSRIPPPLSPVEVTQRTFAPVMFRAA